MEIITKSEWKTIPKNYKSIIEGKHYILKLTNEGTCLVPVNLVSDKEVQKNGK